MENNQFKRMQKLAGIITEEKQTYDAAKTMVQSNMRYNQMFTIKTKIIIISVFINVKVIDFF
jgi:hypothetical protein